MMLQTRFSRALLSTFFVLASAAPWPLFAQSSISGTVRDREGRPIAEARVSVRTLVESAIRYNAETDAQGRYQLESFDASRAYHFRVEKAGFRPFERDVEVGLDGTVLGADFRQDFVLSPEGSTYDEEPGLVVLSRPSAGAAAYSRAIKAFQRGDLEKARQRLESAHQLDPDLDPIDRGLALVQHRLGNHAEALAAADRGLARHPGHPFYLRVRYASLRDLGQVEEGRAALLELAEADWNPSTASLFFNEGVGAVRGGDFELAERLFQGALRLDPDMLRGRGALAKVYAQNRKYESAAVAAGKVLAAEPGNVEMLRVQQQAYAASGDPERARQALDELIRRDPGPRTATLLYNQGVEAFNADDNDSAAELFQLALRADPGHLEATLGLAEVYLRQKKYEAVLEITGEVLANDPSNSHAARIRGRARVRMGAE